MLLSLLAVAALAASSVQDSVQDPVQAPYQYTSKFLAVPVSKLGEMTFPRRHY